MTAESEASFCDKCYGTIEECGILRCNGIDLEFQVPLINLYHRECYDTLTEQENIPSCTDCVSDPCFIKRKSLK